jgi:EAL domain-containing protein (putative c-di-GMP-specific phosphodiesterase class I)
MKLDSVVSTGFSQLKQLGVGFSIDDFGTGYSNLGYLQSFEAEILKIDKRFIDGTPLDEKNSKLVKAILQMARSFNMTVVAEGVEYREQRDFLSDNGCDQIQGYFYSKPLQAKDALEFALKEIDPAN